MHVPEGKSKPECSFTDSHANILKMRARMGNENSERKKKR